MKDYLKSRHSNIYPKTKTAKRRPKLGEKKQKGQLTMQEALGHAPKAKHEPEQNATTRDDKKFGNKLEPKKKLLFCCATHNINNISPPHKNSTPSKQDGGGDAP